MRFDFHGVTVEVASRDAEALRFLRANFSLQEVEDAAAGEPRADVTLVVEPESAGRFDVAPRGHRRLFRTKDAVVTRRAGAQLFESAGRAAVLYDFRIERGVVYGPDRDLALEKCYLLITSRVGALLDRRGLHRVHAMGVAVGDAALLCAFPMGGGKTTLALDMLLRDAGVGGASDATRPRTALLSDDCPLVDFAGCAHPFAVRIGVNPGGEPAEIPDAMRLAFPRSRHGPKTLLDARYFADRIAPRSRVRVFAYGRRADRAAPVAHRRSRLAGLRVLWSAGVLGAGLPELLEYTVPCSIGGALELVRVRLSRLRAMLALARGAAIYELVLGTDRTANAALVRGLLDAEARA
ncbi:MAG: hypothetical protein ACKVU1_13530 [bacterium]